MRGGGCGRPASGGLSFSITKSVATKHPVDVTPYTLPTAAGQCYSYIIAANRMDGRRDVRWAWWDVWGGGRRDGQTRVWAGASPSSPRSSLSHHAPHAAATHGGLSGAGAWTDRRTDGWPCARQRSLITGVRLRTKTTLLQYYQQFHAVTK